jgi:translation initiation factor IF-2
VPVVGVSATKGLNLDELREAVLLQAELLELHEEHEASAEGVVLEAAVHKGMGIVASVLVQRGTLRTQVMRHHSWLHREATPAATSTATSTATSPPP